MRFRTLRDYIASLSTVTPTGLDRVPLHDLSNTADMSAATFDGIVDGVAADATLARTTGATFTGNVVVPDANADGEAIAYDQLAARVRTFEIEDTAPILTLDESDQAANARVWRFAPFSGTMYIGPADDAGALLAQSLRLERNGDVKIAPAGGGKVTVPDATADGEAIAYDQLDWVLDRGTFDFTGTGETLLVRGNQPAIDLYDDFGGTDGMSRWRFYALDNSLYLQRRDNAGATTTNTPIQFVGNTNTMNLSGNTNVIVPDANADGEAIAYDQVNWRLGNGTLTGNLTIDKGNPTIFLDNDTGAGGQSNLIYFRQDGVTRHAISSVSGNPNRLAFGTYDGSGAYQAAPLIIDATDDQVEMTGAASVVVPAISGTGQAAQVTAYDATTGRLAIGGIEMGSTGWRTVASWTAGVQDGSNQIGTISSDFTLNGTGVMQMKRSGDLVHVRWTVEVANGITTTTNTLKALFTAAVWPQGFTFGSSSSQGGQLSVQWPIGVVGRIQRQAVSADVRIWTSASDAVLGEATLVTQASWPTSLPGTQATAPFS